MRIKFSIVLYSFFQLLTSSLSYGSSHLVLKSDFDGDGVSDRVVFASHGISGFAQSTLANKKVDTFFLKQGNRSIFFTSYTSDKIPYIKITEDVGFYSVVTLMRYENREFKHISSYTLPSEVYFSDDFFSDTVTINSNSTQICQPNDALNNKSIAAALSWAEMLKQNSLEETIKKSIDASCKNVFGTDYSKLEKEIISACKIESSADAKKQNTLIACLDKNKGTRTTSSSYQTALASAVFDDGFKINCESIPKANPKASFNRTSKVVSIFQLTPPEKNRSYKADFFHEMLHSTGIKADNKILPLVQNCIGFKNLPSNLDKTDDRMYISNIDIEKRNVKDGVEVNIPTQVKKVPQSSIASAVTEGSKALDKNFSMENGTQYESLSKASKATFRSFDPIMKAAYEAAVPTAFAQGSLAATSSTSSGSISIPTVKASTLSASRAIASSGSAPTASGATYDVSSLPESVPASAKGDLGNGMAIKASEVAFDAVTARAPASSEVASAGTSGGGAIGGSVGPSIAGSLASIKTTDRPDLRANVPQLKTEEDFLKTLTTGKYDEVKAKLVDPKNQRILEEKKIQYVAKDKTLGSKQPVIILKDLGNKFTVLRVNVE